MQKILHEASAFKCRAVGHTALNLAGASQQRQPGWELNLQREPETTVDTRFSYGAARVQSLDLIVVIVELVLKL